MFIWFRTQAKHLLFVIRGVQYLLILQVGWFTWFKKIAKIWILPFTLRILKHADWLNLKFRAEFRKIPQFLLWHYKRSHFGFLKLLLNFQFKFCEFNLNFRVDEPLLLQRTAGQGNFITIFESLSVEWLNLFNCNRQTGIKIKRLTNVMLLFSLLVLRTWLNWFLQLRLRTFSCLL